MPHHKISYETKKKLARISYLSKVYNDALAEQMQYKNREREEEELFGVMNGSKNVIMASPQFTLKLRKKTLSNFLMLLE